MDHLSVARRLLGVSWVRLLGVARRRLLGVSWVWLLGVSRMWLLRVSRVWLLGVSRMWLLRVSWVVIPRMRGIVTRRWALCNRFKSRGARLHEFGVLTPSLSGSKFHNIWPIEKGEKEGEEQQQEEQEQEHEQQQQEEEEEEEEEQEQEDVTSFCVKNPKTQRFGKKMAGENEK